MIDKAFGFIAGRQFILTIIFLAVVAFLASLFNRYIYIDDAWFGEQAYWFSKLAYVKTSSIIDFYGWDERLFVYHKLNIIIGAALIKLFGWSVTPLRSFTLLVFLVFLFVIFRSLKSRSLEWHQIDSRLVFFFLIVHPLTLLFAFSFRPEILVMSLGFFSFVLLTGKSTKARLLLSAVLAGTALLVHLNGVMFIVAGFALLLLKKKLKSAFIFGFSAALVASFYFYDLWQPGHLETFLFQIKHWPDNITTNYQTSNWADRVLSILTKLGREHQRFFWGPDVWGLSAVFVLALVFKGKTLWKKHKDLLAYLLIADVALNLLGSQIAEVYMLLLLPFMALIAASFFTELKKTGKPVLQSIGIVLVLFQIVSSVSGLKEIFDRRENTVAISAKILSAFPGNNEKVLVPYRFVFNQLPEKNQVSYKTMEYHQVEHGRKLTKDEFLELAVQLGINYLVVPPEILAHNKMYPWMNEEFKVEGESFVKLKIETGTKALLRVD